MGIDYHFKRRNVKKSVQELYEELDIDSIDAVDLIVELKAYTGRKIGPEDFKNVRTVGDLVTALDKLLNDE